MVDLPAELIIWNQMTPMQRLEVMQKVRSFKSLKRTLHECLKFIKKNMVTA